MSKYRSFDARKLVSAALIVVMSMFAVVGVVAAQDANQTDTAEASHAYLGVYYSNVDEGARIDQVIPDSPAEDAGLEAADVITAVGEDTVDKNFSDLVAAHSAGDVITLAVTRGEESLNIEVTLGEAPAQVTVPDGNGNFRFDFGNGRGGRNFQFNMRPGEVQYLEEEKAWEIGELADDSALAEAGLQQGDKVTAITVDGEAIDPSDMGRGLGLELLMQDKPVTLTVERDGESQEIEVKGNVAAALILSANFGGNFRFEMPDAFPFTPPFPGRDGQAPNLIPAIPRIPQALGVRLGVGFVMLDENGASQYGVEQTEGAYITQVVEASPAGAAGLLEGDVVTEADGEALTVDFNLRDAIAKKQPGDVVKLTVVRDGATQEIEVTLGQPEQFGMNPQG